MASTTKIREKVRDHAYRIEESVRNGLSRVNFIGQVAMGAAYGITNLVGTIAIRKARSGLEKASSMDLTTGLLSKRMLSLEEAEKVKKGVPELAMDLDKKPGRRKDVEYIEDNRGLVVATTFYEWKKAGDISFGLKRLRTGHYPTSVITCIYDSKTRKLKEVETIDFEGDRFFYAAHHVTFNPPGRLIGERKRLKH